MDPVWAFFTVAALFVAIFTIPLMLRGRRNRTDAVRKAEEAVKRNLARKRAEAEMDGTAMAAGLGGIAGEDDSDAKK
jgi:uncharacterized membrane protein